MKNTVKTTYTKKRGRKSSLTKRSLVWCPRHSFVILYEGGKYVTMLPSLSCGCSPFSSDLEDIKTITQVINKVSTIKHAKWYKTLSIKKWRFHIVKY